MTEFITEFINHHLAFALQMLTIAAIVLVLTQVKLSDELDQLRWTPASRMGWLVETRRWAQLAKIMALIWMVVYSDMQRWQPWPPVIAFIAAFDFYVTVNIFVLREDLKRVRETANRKVASASPTG